MSRSRAIRVGVAAAVAGAGLAAGGVGIAAAAGGASSTHDHAGAREGWGPGLGLRHGPGGLPGVEARLADLAKALGVSEDDLRKALRGVRGDLRPERREARTRPGPPSAAERKAMQKRVVAALAKELDLSEAKVSAALDEVRADAKADRRAALEKRLKGAVDDGDLTADDQASVLKAYDLGLLGGPPLGGPPR